MTASTLHAVGRYTVKLNGEDITNRCFAVDVGAGLAYCRVVDSRGWLHRHTTFDVLEGEIELTRPAPYTRGVSSQMELETLGSQNPC